MTITRLRKIGKSSTMTRTNFRIFVINGNSGSLKTRVGRILSGHNGGMRWRKMILERRIRWMNGGRQKIWGTQRRVMTSPSFIGIIKSENEGNATTMNLYRENN